MNDDELIAVLREQRGSVLMTTPVEQIISRGHAVRARRYVSRAAAAVAVTAAAAFAVTAELPDGHAALPTSHPTASSTNAELAAWTVTRQTDGSVQFTLREAADPAGLQRTLRAAGVPVSVTFDGQDNPACHNMSFLSLAPWPMDQGRWDLNGDGGRPGLIEVIHPEKLPPGVGLHFSIVPRSSETPEPANNTPGWPPILGLKVGAVQTSPQCTGS